MHGELFSANLCPSCVHSNGCALHSQSRKLAYECDTYEEARLSKAAVRAVGRAALKAVHAKRKSNGSAGLCSDCENRRRCVLAPAHGGVWHCEEYR